MPAAPDAWQSCAAPLTTGEAGALDPARDPRSLAQTLAAGHVVPPWQIGLIPDDFRDSFDNNMGYVDAFRLWATSAFDDRLHLQHYFDPVGTPASWYAWLAEHVQRFG